MPTRLPRRGPGAPRPVRPTLHARPAPVAVRAEPSSVALSEPEPEIDQVTRATHRHDIRIPVCTH